MVRDERRGSPLFGIRVRVADLTLRPLTEPDADLLAGMLPSDVEPDPESPALTWAPAATVRATIVRQSYWRAMGTWTPDEWRLTFGVWRGERLVGAQELEGRDFTRLRTVDTSSFLAVESRGQGVGKAMRRGVLGLAFGRLAAEYAITSAWHDNHASLGVSRALGYGDNGIERHRRGEGVDDMVHLRLSRETWLASAHAHGISIELPDDARPYFGLS